MPRNEYSTNFALMSDFDARSYSTTLFTRRNSLGNDINVTLPSTSKIVFDDPLQFLNGNGQHTQTSFKRALDLVFGDTWEVGINSSDNIYLYRDNDQSVNVYFYSGSGQDAEDLFGVQAGTYSTGQVILPFGWRRGLEYISAGEKFVVDGGGFKLAVLPHIQVFQDIPSLLNIRYGNGAYCLESVEHDNFYVGVGAVPFIQWILDNDGHVIQIVYAPPTNPNLKTFSWVDTTFRDRLGFSGNETWTAISGANYYWQMRADHPMAGVLIPSRPYEDKHMKFDRVSNAKRKLEGGYTSNRLGNYPITSISFHLDAYADVKNDYRHYIDTCGAYFYEGARVSLYQDWGESRLSLRSSQIKAGQSAYDLYYTSENDGSNGIIRGYLTSLTKDLPFPSGIRRRVPITMEIEHG